MLRSDVTNMAYRVGRSTTGGLPPVEGLSAGSKFNVGDKTDMLNTAITASRHHSHKDKVTQVKCMGSYVITCSVDRAVKCWDAHSLQLKLSMECPRPVLDLACLRLDEQRTLILAACQFGYVYSWRLNHEKSLTSRMCNVFNFHVPNPIRTLVTSPDGAWVSSGCCYAMYEVQGGRLVESVRGSLKVWRAQDIVTASEDTSTEYADISKQAFRTVRELVSNDPRRKYRMQPRDELQVSRSFGVRSLAFTPDGTLLVVGLGTPWDSRPVLPDSKVVLCRPDSLETLNIVTCPGHQVTAVRCCTATPHVIVVTTNDSVLAYDIKAEGRDT